jgi:hypothetical protein
MATTPNKNGLHSELIKQFRENGVVFLKGALTADELQKVADVFEHKLTHRTQQAFEMTSDNGGVFLTDGGDPLLPQTEVFAALNQGTPISDLAAGFFSSPDAWFYYEQLFYKHGGPARRTPWHQDTSYVPVDGPDIVRFWICFDSVDKAHSLEFVRGSHKGPLYNGSSFSPNDDTAPLYPDSDMPRLPDIQADREHWDIVSWAVEPGDIIAFHPSMLHGGADTPADGKRRSLSLVFFGEQAYFAPRPSGTVEASAEAADLPADAFGGVQGSPIKAGDPFHLLDFLKLR